MKGVHFLFLSVLLVTVTKLTCTGGQMDDDGNYVEDEEFIPVWKNTSLPFPQEKRIFTPRRDPAKHLNTKSFNQENVELMLEDDLLLQLEGDDVLSRHRREVEGTGDGDEVTATLTLDVDPGISSFSASVQSGDSSEEAVRRQLEQEFADDGVTIESMAITKTANGNTFKYTITCGFTGDGDPIGVAYALSILHRRVQFGSFSITTVPTIFTDNKGEVSVICFLCPEDRPCSNGECRTSTVSSSSSPFPYGFSEADSRLGRSRWDISSGRIYIEDGFPFYDNFENVIYVGDNGGVTFGSQYNSYFFRSIRYAMKYICVYCADFDIISRGNVFYHVYAYGDFSAEHALARATAEVRARTRQRTFQASWVMVITWDDVPFFSWYHSWASDRGSTFQLVLITDGQVSYVMFFYVTIQDSYYTRYHREQAVHGFKGQFAGQFTELEYSRRDIEYFEADFFSWYEKPRMDQVRGNSLSQKGVWMFKVGDIINLSPERKCYQWFLQNFALRKQFRTRARSLRNDRCPCLRRWLPWTAIFLPLSPYWWYNPYCVEMRATFGLDTYECCYDRWGRFINRLPDAGTYVRFRESLGRTRHYFQDSGPKQWCCRESRLCRLYKYLRPRSSCSWEVPRAIRFWNSGDPHFMTLDGKVYTFNGLGEYTLMELENKTFTFKLHCRTAQAKSETGEKVKATVFSAFAFEQKSETLGTGRVHVGLNTNRTKMVIYIDDVDKTLEFQEPDFQTQSPFLSVLKENDTNIQIAFPQIDVVVTVSLISGTLSQSAVLPETYRGLTKGLLGNYNGDDTDDFVSSTGSPYLATSTDEVLYQFGQSWALTNMTESVLHYAPGEDISTFTNSSYTPLFEEDIAANTRAEAEGVCGGKDETQCIYDYAVTGNKDLAIATTTQIEEARNTTKYLSNRSPALSGTTQILIEAGQEVRLTYEANDADNDIVKYYTVGDTPSDFTLNETSGEARVKLNSSDRTKITIVATDVNGADSPVIEVEIRYCRGCGPNGTCDYSTPEVFPTSENDALFQTVICTCDTGYTGANCSEDKNGCEDNVCNNRTCQDVDPEEEANSGYAFKCSPCSLGYESDTVTQAECKNIDECVQGQNCTANSRCEDTPGSYICICEIGYRKNSEEQCDDIDECFEESHDCQHKCNNTDGGFICDCFPGYTLDADNKTCNGTPKECNSLNCSQVCDTTARTCACKSGYKLGDDNATCIDIDECQNNLCSQICTNTNGSYSCSCNAGFKLGSDKQSCLKCGFPRWGVECNFTCECQGQGFMCDPALGCLCQAGETGVNCDGNVNECEMNLTICGSKQICNDTEDAYICSCPPGYTEDGFDCIDINECEDDDTTACPANSVCNNVNGSYTCDCDVGFKKDGDICSDIDECDNGQANCEHSCVNKNGSYNCYCAIGHTLNDDRRTCTKDLDETDPCEGLTLNCTHYCTVVDGNSVCRCNRGYFLGSDLQTCTDIDECSDDTLNLCTNKDTCTNTPGSYTCRCTAGSRLDNNGRTCVSCDEYHWGESCSNNCDCEPLGTKRCDKVKGCVCNQGWTGDKCQDDVDECTSTATCLAISDCLNTPGSYRCICRTGYGLSANASACEDIDECSEAADNLCDQDCRNTVGSYLCSCRPGFIKEGKGSCNDINECSLGTHACDHKCRNTQGGYACECYDGYQLTKERRKCTLKPGATTCNRTDCSANGGCRVKGGIDICFCNTGYQLSDADNTTCDDIDECDVNTTCSQNCTNSPAGTYTCSCSVGFLLAADKTTCEACPDGTYGANCTENCSCDATNTISCNATDGSCTCRTGWNGTTCTEDVPECADDSPICGTNGTCGERNGSYSCTCNKGYIRTKGGCIPCTSITYGINCAEDCTCDFANTDSCDSINGSCTCKEGWNGTNCSTDVDECSEDLHNCTDTEVCRNTSGSFVCDCHPGLWKSSQSSTCVECTSPTYGFNCASKCTCVFPNTASCDPVNGSCTCNTGWIGTNCETNVDECSATPSVCTETQEVCRDTNGSFVCDCNPGFGRPTTAAACAACNSTSYGTNCENACTCISGNSLSCNSVNGSCTCNTGWTGTNCETNVDECSATPSVCTETQEVCRDTNGSFVCDCNPGFGRPTTAAACAACNSTSYGTNCENACTCISGNSVSCNSVNGSCTCNTGWTGTNCETNVDECSATPSVCTETQEVCRDTNGSYVCDCNPGFGRPTSGSACADRNECLSSAQHTCQYHCDNTEGSFTCSCPYLYFGTGNECTVLPLALGLSIPIFILLALVVAVLVFCCCRRRRRRRRDSLLPPSSEDRDGAFRSLFFGGLATKSSYGASRYQAYSPHTLSDAASQVSDTSHRTGRSGRSDWTRRSDRTGRRDKTGRGKSYAFKDTPWVQDRFQGLTETSRDLTSAPIREEPTSNFSWEHLFSVLEPQGPDGQYEVPRPQVDQRPNRTYLNSQDI
ncbi:uncharacterized protein LOC124135986 isoform X1 [Haliotis rufescens]|uniref:uncharacterized protein LOC124135986 isoform X1 n=1 Tax=Haliotis rufescens TaxID=6454 RepID=UPI00201EA28E|nr:uncharacterized protein LOC124135986 isoform X1 [Haliotis rufescens]